MKEEVKKFFKGEVEDDEKTLASYSHDASIFEVRPRLVVYPQDAADISGLVDYAREKKVPLTVRAAGSDMTGGPLGEGIVLDVTKHMHKIGEVKGDTITVEPGVFYRDLEKALEEHKLSLPCYPASKDIAALGGMFGNNCAGEKTLRYGKMEHFVLESKAIFSDGREYTIRPLTKAELEAKMSQGDFEGNVYKEIFALVEVHSSLIAESKPKVSKNSAGYYLWNVWDGQTFDLNRLLVGSQGTLGIVTEIKLRLLPTKPYHDMVALFFKTWSELPQVVNAILPYEPESLETFDSETIKLGIRFMPEIAKKTGSSTLAFATKFLPEAWIGVKMLGMPKLVVLVEVSEESEKEVGEKVAKIVEALKPFRAWYRVVERDSDEEKFWVMRRESFNLLRKHTKGKRTAPFIEDFCLEADKVPEFLPQATEILKDAGIEANIAGHAGNGNFHIIPLMDLSKASERAKIPQVADKFFDLVARYGGSISGEHNDGIVRTPYLHKMYSRDMLEIFKKTKDIFDPINILNPGKKVPQAGSGQVGGSVEYLSSHIAQN